jgi:hypothetical protein
MWVTVRPDQLSEEEPKRTNRGHSFINISRYVSWPTYCRHCGLIPLKNDISQFCVRLGCDYELDGRYKLWLKTGRL